MSGQQLQRSLKRALFVQRPRLWIGAVVLILSAVLIGRLVLPGDLRPAICGWNIDDRFLVINVSLSNTTHHALSYCHHPFPTRFLTDRGWTDAEIINGFRSAVLNPGAALSVEVIIAQPQEKPIRLQVGTDFETHGVLPPWLARLNGSNLSPPFRPILDQILGLWQKARPVRCLWSDAVLISDQEWSRKHSSSQPL